MSSASHMTAVSQCDSVSGRRRTSGKPRIKHQEIDMKKRLG